MNPTKIEWTDRVWNPSKDAAKYLKAAKIVMQPLLLKGYKLWEWKIIKRFQISNFTTSPK